MFPRTTRAALLAVAIGLLIALFTPFPPLRGFAFGATFAGAMALAVIFGLELISVFVKTAPSPPYRAGNLHQAEDRIHRVGASRDGLNAQRIKHTKEVRGKFPLARGDYALGIGDFSAFEVAIAGAVCDGLDGTATENRIHRLNCASHDRCNCPDDCTCPDRRRDKLADAAIIDWRVETIATKFQP